MSFIRKFYRWLSVLSIDVAAGAVASSFFFADLAHLNLLPTGLVCLGLTVWIIYTTDHLMDAVRLTTPASTVRHRYHQQHFWALAVALFVALSMVGVLLFFIRPQVFQWGSVLSVLVLIYMIVNRFLRFLKEVVVAVIYVTGVLLPTLAQLDSPWVFLTRPEVMSFLMLVLLNLLIFSWYEITTDREDGHPSFAGYFGAAKTLWVMTILGGIQVITLLVLFILTSGAPACYILTAMSMVLLLIVNFPKFFLQDDRYRMAGDAIFLFPAVGSVLHHILN